MVHRKAVFYPRECHDILDSRSRGTWSEASVLKKKLKGSPSAKSIIHRVNRSSLFYSVTNGIESLFFNFIYTTPFNQHKPHNLLYLLVPSSSRLIIIKINKDTSHKNTRLTKIFLSIYHTFTSLPHSSIIVCHSRSNHALVSRETREVAGTRLDHMGTWFDNLFPLYVSRRICRKRKKKRGGKDVRTNEARATKLKKKSLRERGNVVGKKYFSSREDTVISLVRRSALRKGRGVTELYESTPVLSLSLRIPSPSIILLLRPSTTQTPSLPSRRSSLSSFHPLSLSLSLGLLFHSSFPPPPFLAVSSFLPFFLHPPASLVRLFLLPAKRASILTPCWSQCRSNPLREHISPWPPQSLLTWSLNQYPLPLPKGFLVLLSHRVICILSSTRLYIRVYKCTYSTIPSSPLPYAVYPTYAPFVFRATSFVCYFASIEATLLLPPPREHSWVSSAWLSRCDAFYRDSLPSFPPDFFPRVPRCRNLVPLRIEGTDK